MADRYGPPAGSAYGGPYQQRPQPPPHQSSYRNNNNNNTNDYHRNDPSSQNYDDARQPLQQGYHSPYRDSPSPELHPGMTPSSNRYNNQLYPPQPYDSPSRKPATNPQRNPEPYGPAAGGAAVAAAAVASASGYRGPQDQQYQPYLPAGNMGRFGESNGSNNFAGQDSRGGEYGPSGQHSPYGAYQNPQSQSSHASYSSADHLTSAAAAPAMSAPQAPYSQGGYGAYSSNNNSPSRVPLNHPYQNPYDNHSISRNNLNGMDFIDPNAVADDGDDGLEYYNPKRRSMISLNRRSMGSNTALAAGAGAAGVAATAGENSRNMYTPDAQGDMSAEKAAPSGFPSIAADEDNVKSAKWKKWLFLLIGVLILGGIAAGVVVGLMERNKGNNGNGGSSSSSSQGTQGVDGPDMNLNSPSVKKLLNNKNLHKVFMGMAYTPMNTQYPDCMTTKPIQNNITLDMAVIGQTTNVVRLYGTDCNQTEMVLHAIDQLQFTDMKVWVGVWLDNNMTTNARQVQQLYNILDGPNTKYIKGVVVGNEVLFRQDLTVTQLEDYITNVRSNLTSRGINLPVASSDLGDNWTTALAAAVDVVMSNVHPFFGGVTVDLAAAWTWNFWQQNDVILTKGTSKGQVISEVGWPSQGGNDCAPSLTCPDSTSGSVAGLPQMQTFLNSWVCETLANGTEYLW